ncbi:MAG: hypothetical protein NC240_01440 [Clostridium sp.]|nr:hypothetical protein [Clostridium sp.]
MNKTKKLIIALIIVFGIAVLAVVFAVVRNMNQDSASGTSKGGTSKIQTFSNQGNTYTLKLDSYVTFSDSTSRSDVNNEDGLEVNYSDVYITIQRFPSAAYQDNFSSFVKFIKEMTNMGSINVQNSDLVIQNDAVTDYDVSYVSASGFVGYLIYMRTDNGMYKLLISGSDKDVVEHYKTFVNDMEFR